MQRIHLECEPLAAPQDDADESIATTVTAYLHPDAARFLDWPVVEVRLMDSLLWSDRQYVLDAPYPAVARAMRKPLVARCQAMQDEPSALVRRDCTVTRTDQGMFIDSSAGGGAWVHPDPHDPQRTVYAESWAE